MSFSELIWLFRFLSEDFLITVCLKLIYYQISILDPVVLHLKSFIENKSSWKFPAHPPPPHIIKNQSWTPWKGHGCLIWHPFPYSCNKIWGSSSTRLEEYLAILSPGSYLSKTNCRSQTLDQLSKRPPASWSFPNSFQLQAILPWTPILCGLTSSIILFTCYL